MALGVFFLMSPGPRPALSQTLTPCDLAAGPAATFPRIPLCAFTGAYQDSSLINPARCLGAFHGPLADSIAERPRTVTVRFRRDRRVEARPDFGGYRVYRVQNYTGPADTARMVLIRRFSRQLSDTLMMWHFSVVDPATLEFKCNNRVVTDSIVTFIDPDSSGAFARVCRLREPQNDPNGVCKSPFDSVLVLRPPPGPHDGFRTWYTITYEVKNSSLDGNFADMFVPDTAAGHCATPSLPLTCPNANNKLLNLTPDPVELTRGPTVNLERVIVVPNPYRSSAPWDSPNAHELHFTNLPSQALIRIYTVAGDLVAELRHSDKIHDFERWNLKNDDGKDVASGIYMYRVEASSFSFQDRFIVIR